MHRSTTLKFTLLATGGASLLLLVVLFAWTQRQLDRVNAAAARNDALARATAVAKNVRFHAVPIQRFLTDAGASGETAAIDEGRAAGNAIMKRPNTGLDETAQQFNRGVDLPVNGTVRGVADSLVDAARQVSTTAQMIALATSEQAASVEKASARVEEMGGQAAQLQEPMEFFKLPPTTQPGLAQARSG